MPLVVDATDQVGEIPGGFGHGDLSEFHIGLLRQSDNLIRQACVGQPTANGIPGSSGGETARLAVAAQFSLSRNRGKDQAACKGWTVALIL
jgi:hypothetical protein